MSHPEWLPDLFPVSPWQHDAYEALYRLLEQDFKPNQPVYDGRAV